MLQTLNRALRLSNLCFIDTDEAFTQQKVSSIDFIMDEQIVIDPDDGNGLFNHCADNHATHNVAKKEVKNENIKYKKPSRPCPFCSTAQAQLKCHNFTKHSTEPFVMPIIAMNPRNQNRHIDMLRKQAIRNHMALLKAGEKSFKCERKSAGEHDDLPLMCSWV